MRTKCLNCPEKIEYELIVKPQIITCDKCGCQVKIKCFKNGRATMRYIGIVTKNNENPELLEGGKD
jgi:hypothetical protein